VVDVVVDVVVVVDDECEELVVVVVVESNFQIVFIGLAVVAFPRYPETPKPSSMVLRKPK